MGKITEEYEAVKFGLPLFGVSPRFYADIAKSAEDNGFESVWMPEHLVFPESIPPTYLYSESGYPPVSSDTPLFDVWVSLAYIAHATSSIRLATNVYVLPLRHPIEVARSVVTLDRLSNGRVTMGIGVGWLAEEFEAVGRGFHDRGRRADDMIVLMRRLWHDDVIEVHDDHFDFGPVKFQPKPALVRFRSRSGASARPRCAGPEDWGTAGSRSVRQISTRSAKSSMSSSSTVTRPVATVNRSK